MSGKNGKISEQQVGEETEQGIKQTLRKSGANDQNVDQVLRKRSTEIPSKVSSKKPSH